MNHKAFLFTIFLFWYNTYIKNEMANVVNKNTDIPKCLSQKRIDCMILKIILPVIIVPIFFPPYLAIVYLPFYHLSIFFYCFSIIFVL